jgi:uncharacterized protein (TIGR03437 family)
MPLPTRFLPVLISLSAFAQTTAAIQHLGYQAPRPVLVAPGQVLHLTVHGLTTSFDSTQVAQHVPLPTDFNGLSISLQRTGSAQPELLPLLHGDGAYSSCAGGAPVFFLGSNAVPCVTQDGAYDLWVQIPYDLPANSPGADNVVCSTDPNNPPGPCPNSNLNDAVLTVIEKSGAGASFRIAPVIDQVHLINSCTDNLDPAGPTGISVYASYPCRPLITHLDGSAVTPATPARPAEELVAYAFGLGVPSTIPQAVNATPAGGLPVTHVFKLSFTGIAQPAAAPDYVGLVAGQAGLYQVNFRVPSVPASLPPCSTQNSLTQLPANPFNLTMTLMGSASLDQASFCVQPD